MFECISSKTAWIWMKRGKWMVGEERLSLKNFRQNRSSGFA